MKEGNPFAQKHLTKISKNGEMKVIQLRPAEQTNWKEKSYDRSEREKKSNTRRETADCIKNEGERKIAGRERR